MKAIRLYWLAVKLKVFTWSLTLIYPTEVQKRRREVILTWVFALLFVLGCYLVVRYGQAFEPTR